ncbi:hypothetical protein OQA88_3379 [Cercophora sp. LCS_1]
MATESPPPRPILGDRINAATRPIHTKLNKSILARMPLALPPSALNPTLYATGILHIAPIYLVFESLWRNIVLSDTSTPTTQRNPPFLTPSEITNYPFTHSHSSISPAICPPGTRSLLIHLHLPTLLRSPSLHHDLALLTGWSSTEVTAQLRLAAQNGRLAQFLTHIKRSVDRRPHVIIAYAWVLYMALFSGGRFIRAELENAGKDFWSAQLDPLKPGNKECEPPKENGTFPLGFFRFDTAKDGEDLKIEFKSRLAEVEKQLSEKEVDEVVQEAKCVFENMVSLVGQLDGVVASNERWEEGGFLGRFFGGRVRDSLAVARERGVKPAAAGANIRRGSSETGISGMHAQGMVMSSAELVEKRTVVGDERASAKVVRFGGENKGEEGPSRRRRFGSLPNAWNAALFVGVVGVVWGIGQAAR